MGLWVQATTEISEIHMVFYVESLGFKMLPINSIFKTLIGQIKNNHSPHLLALTFCFILGLLNLNLVLSNDPSTKKCKLLKQTLSV